MNQTPLRPHPQLEHYYRNDLDRAGMVSDLFNEGAPYYERICSVMSFGTGENYRRQALVNGGLTAGMRLLDVATGTGLVLRSATTLTQPAGLAVGLDPSRGMLRECRKGCASPLLQGLGEQLPFGDASFDMVSMGYALRHVADLRALFAEYHRVLKPGGRVLILEITQPRSSAGRWLNRVYLSKVVPLVTRLSTGAVAASRMMAYFWDTIESCVPPEVILGALKEAGFADARRAVMGGILSEYIATKNR